MCSALAQKEPEETSPKPAKLLSWFESESWQPIVETGKADVAVMKPFGRHLKGSCFGSTQTFIWLDKAIPSPAIQLERPIYFM